MVDILGYQYRPCADCLWRSFRRSSWYDKSGNRHWQVLHYCSNPRVTEVPDNGSSHLSCVEFVGQLNIMDL